MKEGLSTARQSDDPTPALEASKNKDGVSSGIYGSGSSHLRNAQVEDVDVTGDGTLRPLAKLHISAMKKSPVFIAKTEPFDRPYSEELVKLNKDESVFAEDKLRNYVRSVGVRSEENNLNRTSSRSQVASSDEQGRKFTADRSGNRGLYKGDVPPNSGLFSLGSNEEDSDASHTVLKQERGQSPKRVLSDDGEPWRDVGGKSRRQDDEQGPARDDRKRRKLPTAASCEGDKQGRSLDRSDRWTSPKRELPTREVREEQRLSKQPSKRYSDDIPPSYDYHHNYRRHSSVTGDEERVKGRSPSRRDWPPMKRPLSHGEDAKVLPSEGTRSTIYADQDVPCKGRKEEDRGAFGQHPGENCEEERPLLQERQSLKNRVPSNPDEAEDRSARFFDDDQNKRSRPDAKAMRDDEHDEASRQPTDTRNNSQGRWGVYREGDDRHKEDCYYGDRVLLSTARSDRDYCRSQRAPLHNEEPPQQYSRLPKDNEPWTVRHADPEELAPSARHWDDNIRREETTGALRQRQRTPSLAGTSPFKEVRSADDRDESSGDSAIEHIGVQGEETGPGLPPEPRPIAPIEQSLPTSGKVQHRLEKLSKDESSMKCDDKKSLYEDKDLAVRADKEAVPEGKPQSVLGAWLNILRAAPLDVLPATALNITTAAAAAAVQRNRELKSNPANRNMAKSNLKFQNEQRDVTGPHRCGCCSWFRFWFAFGAFAMVVMMPLGVVLLPHSAHNSQHADLGGVAAGQPGFQRVTGKLLNMSYNEEDFETAPQSCDYAPYAAPHFGDVPPKMHSGVNVMGTQYRHVICVFDSKYIWERQTVKFAYTPLDIQAQYCNALVHYSIMIGQSGPQYKEGRFRGRKLTEALSTIASSKHRGTAIPVYLTLGGSWEDSHGIYQAVSNATVGKTVADFLEDNANFYAGINIDWIRPGDACSQGGVRDLPVTFPYFVRLFKNRSLRVMLTVPPLPHLLGPYQLPLVLPELDYVVVSTHKLRLPGEVACAGERRLATAAFLRIRDLYASSSADSATASKFVYSLSIAPDIYNIAATTKAVFPAPMKNVAASFQGLQLWKGKTAYPLVCDLKVNDVSSDKECTMASGKIKGEVVTFARAEDLCRRMRKAYDDGIGDAPVAVYHVQLDDPWRYL
ncbi:hypothetical protein HPB50_003602 [Hyalomma asiaticum]|uniref:Uncharacterized protein n=1 Tax=Hyalomma asiaticum TaxID=266040 RepID=A0ACB7SZL5_HYAAI|nr:hypothetical protein HPB50_003602 [Hyalomma asiaticum]